MAVQYFTREGDMVDYICWKYYGRQSDAVEAVLETNTHLADEGAVLPAGLVITLPELTDEQSADEGETLYG